MNSKTRRLHYQLRCRCIIRRLSSSVKMCNFFLFANVSVSQPKPGGRKHHGSSYMERFWHQVHRHARTIRRKYKGLCCRIHRCGSCWSDRWDNSVLILLTARTRIQNDGLRGAIAMGALLLFIHPLTPILLLTTLSAIIIPRWHL